MFQSDLSVAELLVLHRPKKVKLADALSIVLKDLTIRRVIKVIKVKSYPNDRSRKTQKYFRFTKGTSYTGYQPFNFEQGIMKAFELSDMVQAKTITNAILYKYSMPSSYVSSEIRSQLKSKGLISAPPVLSGFGMVSLTEKGHEIAAALNQYLDEKEQTLLSQLNGNSEQFIQTLKEVGSLYFFIIMKNPDLYKESIPRIKKIYETKPLGIESDLQEFIEAINIDLSYLHE